MNVLASQAGKFSTTFTRRASAFGRLWGVTLCTNNSKQPDCLALDVLNAAGCASDRSAPRHKARNCVRVTLISLPALDTSPTIPK